MRRFWIVLYTVTAVLHVPFAIGLHEVLRRAGAPAPVLIAIAVAAILVALFWGRVRLVAYDQPVSTLRRLLLEEPYFAHWCATLVTLPFALAGGLVVLALSPFLPPGASPSAGLIMAGGYGAGLVLALWGVIVRRRWVRVRTVDVPIAGLPASFDGYRIAHLSDLHIGSLTPREQAEAWVRRVNALDVDLVALTGDYVTSGVGFHQDIAAVIGAMRGKDGAIAVMGNHDYFGDGEPLISLMRKEHVTVLRNERTLIARGNERIEIAGVDDTWTRRANIRRTLDGRDARTPLVVLAHDPQLFPELARRGAALVLSGHTHWGQVAVPFMSTRYNLSARAYRYHADIYKEGDATLYVHPGLGTTGPPVRLGVAPEITVLRLRPKQA
jgi:hypothetical protein